MKILKLPLSFLFIAVSALCSPLLLQTPSAGILNQDSALFAFASNQGIDFGTAMRMTYNQPSTVEFWYYPTNLAAPSPSLFGNLHSPQGSWLVWRNGTNLRFQMVGDGSVYGYDLIASSFTFVVNTWYQIVVTYTGANTNGLTDFKIYVNGVSQTLTVNAGHNTPITAMNPGTNHTFIGRDYVNDAESGYFNRITFWNAALNQSQVTALYNNGRPKDLTGSAHLVDYYLPGNGRDTSATVYDLAGNANGTPVNSPPYKAFAPFAFAYASSFETPQYPNNTIPIRNGNAYLTYYQAGQTGFSSAIPDLEIRPLSNLSSIIGTLPTTFGVHGTLNALMPMVLDDTNTTYGYIGYYKANSNYYLNVVDISNLASPSVVTTVNSGLTLFQSPGLWKYGNFLYQPGAYGSSNKMLITDVSNPISPTFTTMTIPNAPVSTWAWIQIVGHYMYLATDTTLTIYDMTTANGVGVPSSVGTFTIAHVLISMMALGDYLYLVQNGSNTLEVLDITTRTAPVSRRVLSLSGTYPYAGAIRGSLLYLAFYTSACVKMYSIYDPPNLFEAGSVNLPVYAPASASHRGYGITFNANTAYVPSDTNGVPDPIYDSHAFIDVYNL